MMFSFFWQVQRVQLPLSFYVCEIDACLRGEGVHVISFSERSTERGAVWRRQALMLCLIVAEAFTQGDSSWLLPVDDKAPESAQAVKNGPEG
jgi:hypothetical protein